MLDENALLIDPREQFDSCVIGVCDKSGRAIYSVKKIMNSLINEFMNDDSSLEYKEAYTMAREHYIYNILNTSRDFEPIYLIDFEFEETENNNERNDSNDS